MQGEPAPERNDSLSWLHHFFMGQIYKPPGTNASRSFHPPHKSSGVEHLNTSPQWFICQELPELTQCYYSLEWVSVPVRPSFRVGVWDRWKNQLCHPVVKQRSVKSFGALLPCLHLLSLNSWTAVTACRGADSHHQLPSCCGDVKHWVQCPLWRDSHTASSRQLGLFWSLQFYNARLFKGDDKWKPARFSFQGVGNLFMPSFFVTPLAPWYLLPYFLKVVGHNLCIWPSPWCPPFCKGESACQRSEIPCLRNEGATGRPGRNLTRLKTAE